MRDGGTAVAAAGGPAGACAAPGAGTVGMDVVCANAAGITKKATRAVLNFTLIWYRDRMYFPALKYGILQGFQAFSIRNTRAAQCASPVGSMIADMEPLERGSR
jgi:hypothetical protein